MTSGFEFKGLQDLSSQGSANNSSESPTPTATPATRPEATPAEKWVQSLVHSQHRYEARMYGGWGPHLGHLVRTPNDQLWFVDDSGNDVYLNAGLTYHKYNGLSWSKVATQGLPGQVQQNMGSVVSGNKIYSYGVDIANSVLVECVFNASSENTQGCGTVTSAGASANYVGATISKGGIRVVWWTNVGSSFSYVTNSGNGWNGPFTGGLAGYADFSYVYGRVSDDGSIFSVIGASAKSLGGAAVGYDTLFAQTTLGQPVIGWQNVQSYGLADEQWIDGAGGFHLFFHDYNAKVRRYYYKPPSGALTVGSLTEYPVTLRILETAAEVGLVMGFADSTLQIKRIPKTASRQLIDWAKASVQSIPVSGQLGRLTIYPESTMYQVNGSSGFHFTVNGSSAEASIYHFTLLK